MASDEYASNKQQLIRQITHAHNLIVHLPNYDLDQPNFDIHTEIKDLEGSLFVIADLSLERPSCYYELGIAEAIGKKNYLIARTGTTIHQTVNRKNIQFYQDMYHFKILIDEIIKNALQCKNDYLKNL